MSDTRLRRRELLTAAAAAGVAAVGAGGATWAFLSDQATSDITLNVGSLAIADPAPIEWSEDPDTDGEDSFSDTVTIENDGNLPARQVLLTNIDVNDPALAKALEITDIRYGVSSATSILSAVQANSNGNGIYDLDDLSQSLPITLDEQAGSELLHADDIAELEIDAQFDYSKIPDSKDGKPLDATLTVEGRQQEA